MEKNKSSLSSVGAYFSSSLGCSNWSICFLIDEVNSVQTNIHWARRAQHSEGVTTSPRVTSDTTSSPRIASGTMSWWAWISPMSGWELLERWSRVSTDQISPGQRAEDVKSGGARRREGGRTGKTKTKRHLRPEKYDTPRQGKKESRSR